MQQQSWKTSLNNKSLCKSQNHFWLLQLLAKSAYGGMGGLLEVSSGTWQKEAGYWIVITHYYLSIRLIDPKDSQVIEGQSFWKMALEW